MRAQLSMPSSLQGTQHTLDLVRQGQLKCLSKFVVEPFEDEDEWGVQTVIFALTHTASAPMVLIDRHKDDGAAMAFTIELFDSLRKFGLATASQVVQWRRSLIMVVPKA